MSFVEIYMLYFHIRKKAYTANQNGVQPINDSVKAFASQSESCIVYIQIAVKIWRLFYRRLLQIFLRRRSEESSRFVAVSFCPDVFVWHQEHIEEITERCLSAQTNFNFKEID